MEHYDWNEGWLFTPRFDPALVRPECELELEPVRIPHTVRVLPYNYCSENEYQCLCGYRREFLRPESGRAVPCCSPLVPLPTTPLCSATGGGCSTTAAATPPLRWI
ncbi:MAG: hypothetical protein ACLRRU_06665 [Faecalibacterium sp.]